MFVVSATNQSIVILTIAVCVLAGLFGLLHLVAAASQMAKDHKPTHIVMMVGALLAIAAAVVNLFGIGSSFNLDGLLMAVGGGAVCGAAWQNGKSSGQFHLAHHLLRFGIVLILVFTFIRI